MKQSGAGVWNHDRPERKNRAQDSATENNRQKSAFESRLNDVSSAERGEGKKHAKERQRVVQLERELSGKGMANY